MPVKRAVSIANELLDWMAPALWGMSLVFYVVIFLAFRNSYPFALSMLGAFSVFLGLKITYSNAQKSKVLSKTSTKTKDAASFIHVLLTVIVVFGLAMELVNRIVSDSKEQFNTRRSEFLKNPNGFPYIKEFAKSHYNLDVVLGGMDDAWALTSLTLNLPGQSPASMIYGPGYCILNINRENAQANFSPKQSQDKEAFLKGILIHEFGHCIDVTRDTPNFGQHTYKDNSISPVDKAKVKDAGTFHETSQTHDTILWREVFSDLLMAGYWKLTYPERAQKLIDEWRQIRINKATDTEHQTSCWLDQVKTMEAPKNYRSLREWSDHQRTSFYDKCTSKI
jgi:hypothetical protein